MAKIPRKFGLRRPEIGKRASDIPRAAAQIRASLPSLERAAACGFFSFLFAG
jgi:hypothetical protein